MNTNGPIVTPTSAFLENQYRGARPWRTLLGLYGSHRLSLFWACGLYLVKASPNWGLPLITKYVIDAIREPGPGTARTLGILTVVTLALLLQNLPTHWLYVREISRIARRVEAELRGAIVRRLQLLSISFFKNARGGALQSKVLRDVEAVDSLSRSFFEAAFYAGSSMAAAITVTAWRAPRFLVVFALMVPVAVGLRIWMGKVLQKGNHRFRLQIEQMSAQVSGMIEMIPITRAHAAEEAELHRVNQKLGRVREVGLWLDLKNAVFQSAAWICMNVFTMMSLILGAWAAYTQVIPMTVGDVVMLSTYFGLISGSVMTIANMLPMITRGFESVRSIGEVLESPDLEQNLGKARVGEVRGEFVFENVQFTYRGTDRGSLHDFSLRVRPGDTVAVVGPSGAGKSTLMNLILGFERPTSGRILLDGLDMNAIDLRSYRHAVGVVTQETILFHGTLKENILYGGRNIPDAQMLEALQSANALEFIEKLPEGVNTMLGERGARLSGGQKQRIAIARALIRNPRVLILDEATSALDTASEALVQEALERLMRGRTTFVVAHRLSTIRNAGRILVLDEGRLVEDGTSQELLARGGIYAKLCALQRVG